MALNYFTVNSNSELLTDDLLQRSLDKLEERWERMANWIKENEGLNKCPECENKDLIYRHDGIKCEECGFFKEINVPYPNKGGVVASRKLTSVIKEMFAAELARKRKNEKPTKNQLKSLPFEIGRFDTGEFTPAEIEFLEKRFNELIEQHEGGLIGSDNFLYHIMAQQELILQKIYRKQALEVGSQKRNSLDKKKEFKVYDDIIDNLEVNKKSRKEVEEEDPLEELINNISEDDENIEDIVKKYEKEEKKNKKILEESKKKREEVGNEF